MASLSAHIVARGIRVAVTTVMASTPAPDLKVLKDPPDPTKDPKDPRTHPKHLQDLKDQQDWFYRFYQSAGPPPPHDRLTVR